MKFTKLLVIAALLGGAHMANACLGDTSSVDTANGSKRVAAVTKANDVLSSASVDASKNAKPAPQGNGQETGT